jgi:hypothetical protein
MAKEITVKDYGDGYNKPRKKKERWAEIDAKRKRLRNRKGYVA